MKDGKLVEFLGWDGTEALFQIKRGVLPNNSRIERIIFAREGDWVTNTGSSRHRIYKRHEIIQELSGNGLRLVSQEYSKDRNRSVFTYSFETGDDAILAVPATGEELCYEIYGCDSNQDLHLLDEGEL